MYGDTSGDSTGSIGNDKEESLRPQVWDAVAYDVAKPVYTECDRRPLQVLTALTVVQSSPAIRSCQSMAMRCRHGCMYIQALWQDAAGIPASPSL